MNNKIMRVLRILYWIGGSAFLFYSFYLQNQENEGPIGAALLGLVFSLPISFPLEYFLASFFSNDLWYGPLRYFINTAYFILGYYFWFYFIPCLARKLLRVVMRR